MEGKRISPQAILALKEALPIIFWKKEELQDFVSITLNKPTFVSTINWLGPQTKRESAKELIDRMTARLNMFQDDLLNLILAVTDITDLSHLDFWDEDGTKKIKANEAINKLRSLTKGYIEITKEQEEVRKRRIEAEKKIVQSRSLENELEILKEQFNKIAINPNANERGYQFEKFLVDFFCLFDLDPKGSFKICGEQIDGAFTFDSMDYLLEAKWKKGVDRNELASFSSKVNTKFKSAAGLLVTMEGLTKEAISESFKSIIIMDSSDVIAVLDGRVRLPDLLYKKRRRAAETGQIYISYGDL